jgi:hypothetical protein
MRPSPILAVSVLALLTPRPLPTAEPEARCFTINFSADAGQLTPRIGFLGGLRDSLQDETILPLHPTLWRIGHQFRGRIAGGLPAAIDRVEKLGAKYKLVMSDLIPSNHEDWSRYEKDVKNLVGQTGPRAPGIIWEPVNEPDISHKPIRKYYDLYAHAFKALREADPKLEICGPGFAFPGFDKYREFLDFCRENRLECNYLAWHYTGWDPDAPEQQKWNLGKMPEFIRSHPAQKIREIHCDEWGAGPDKPSRQSPGRLHPGRAVAWFHYLENVYKVDRACRANWGNEDDTLGGIVNAGGEPHPVYHVYRLYADLRQINKVPCEGNDRWMACLAGKGPDRKEILLGSIAKESRPVTLVLKGEGLTQAKLEIRRFAAADPVSIMPESAIPLMAEKEYRRSAEGGTLRITIDAIEENQAYHLRFRMK